MATPPRVSDDPAVQQQYLAQLAVTAALVAAVRGLWESTRPLESAEGLRRFREGVFALVGRFSGAASSIAADFYRAVRADAGVQGVLPDAVLRPIAPPPRSLTDAGIDYALRAQGEARVRVEKRLADRLSEVEAELEVERAEIEATVLARVESAMQKAIADVSREQVRQAAEGDEFAIGYRRVPRFGACAFCISLALRVSSRTRQKVNGKFVHDPDAEHLGVYKTRETAGAASHDDCHCVIEPVFFHGKSEADWLADMRDLYDTFDRDEYGTGLPGFRRALKAFRRGEDTSAPPVPVVAIPAADPRIFELLDQLAVAAN